MEVTMNNKKPIIGAIITMMVIYLLMSFCVWDLNAKHWETPARIVYAMFAPIFAVVAYSAIKGEENEQQ